MSDKYRSNITILGNFESSTFTSILDNNNGTIFIVSDSDLISFKDQHCNIWVNTLDSFHANGKEHYPKLGESYKIHDETFYHFTSKEAIVEMASQYFDKHKYDII